MCGRYLVITEDEIIEMKSILEELNQRFAETGGFAVETKDFMSAGSLSGETLSGGTFPAKSLSKEILSVVADTAGAITDEALSAEAAPCLVTPVLVVEDRKCILKPMKWGFPRWDGKGTVINAKAETVGDKALFREPFLHHRCIIPSRGFFEWKKPSSAPLLDLLSPDPSCPIPGKYWIRREDSPLFFMAGIYQKNPCSEEFVILTMPANLQVAPLHDRMPVFLDKPQLLPWLQDPAVLRLLLQNRTAQVPFLLSHVHSGERRAQ